MGSNSVGCSLSVFVCVWLKAEIGVDLKVFL